jgi:predicted O-linked N-acetylglucosamine transferase (SPINDLY family)
VPALPDPAAALEQCIALAQRGEFDSAERSLRELLDREPSFTRAWNALGVVQMQQGRLEEAELSLLRAAQAAPEDWRAYLNLGKLYNGLRRAVDAESSLRAAARLAPESADAHFSLGALLRDRGELVEAERCVRRAIELSPRDAEVQYLLARLLLDTGRFAQAEFCYRETLRLAPDYALAHSDLAMVLLETGRLREAEESCREAVRIAPGMLRAWSNYVMSGQYDPDATDGELLARAKEAGNAIQVSAGRFAEPLARTAGPSASLCLGIVSGDLHRHPVGLFLLPLLRELGGLGVKATLYSNGTIMDDVSRQLGELAQWSDIARESDAQAWARIRRDAPDVLVDLAGHTGNNRLAIFAARAAPVQLSWLGYFATTGTPNMDCILMDPWHAPDGSEAQFTERVLRMPHTRFCFQPIAAAPQVAARTASAGRIVFCSFNNVAKINEKVVEAWSRILQGTPGSRLVIKWRTLALPECRARIAGWFQRAGIGPERLEFRAESRHEAMLAEYGDIDIALDTFPFTGGQTSFEATWMGVPVVTLAGGRPVSRQTLCILGNLGLEELAARTVDEFVDRAIALAQDSARIRELRGTLRERMQASPLMDAPRFARAFVTTLHDAAGGVV